MVFWIKRLILKIAAIPYVRAAMEEEADLSAFREKPSFKVIAGVFLIGFSYLIGWPAVAALGYLAIALHNQWLIVIGGPLTYGLSHLVFLLGMFLAGAQYSMIFFRWLTRIAMERALTWQGGDTPVPRK